MALDFEALVGHLYIVGGRTLTATPPGALVEVAPRRAARGRELDTFFTLITPSGDSTAPSQFYEQMASLGAERYFASTGSVTAALRSIYNSLNQDLYDHNQSGKQAYEANMLCAVLRDAEVIVARVGAGVAAFQVNGQTQLFPNELDNDEAVFGAPLGVKPLPDMKLSRYNLSQGCRLVLADDRLADLPLETVGAILNSIDLAAVLAGFKDHIGTQAMMLVAEFVPPEAPSPVPARDGRSTAKQSATKPSVALDSSQPDSAPEPPAPPKARQRLGARLLNTFKIIAGGIALFFAKVLEFLQKGLDTLFPASSEGRWVWIKPQWLLAITILLPVTIVLLVVVLGLGNVGNSEFELCLNEADKAADIARAIPSNDVTSTLNAWNTVLNVVKNCQELRPDDYSLRQLGLEGQDVIDNLFQIERRTATLITAFDGASLQRIIQQGPDLYVFDSQNQRVYRVTLDETGKEMVPNSRIILPSIRFNANVGEYRVNTIVDIAWADDTAQIIALDDKGLLIQCSPRFLQSCEGQILLAPERWSSPHRITMWQGRLYILDTAANQIWRYDSSSGLFANLPVEYFAGDTRPDLRNVVDFGIDENGYVYMLTAQGQISKWVKGEATPFTFSTFPSGQQPTSADAMYMDNTAIGRAIYIVTRSNRTVYETTLAGSFINSYRATQEDLFASISDIAVDANTDMVYAVSGNSVFAFSKAAPVG